MTTNEVLQLDCRSEKNKKIIQKVLKQIKPLSKYSDEEDVPFCSIERAIAVMSKKYNVSIRELVPDSMSNECKTIWRANVVNDESIKTIGIAYGLSVYEVFAKTAILMYSAIRKGISVR